MVLPVTFDVAFPSTTTIPCGRAKATPDMTVNVPNKADDLSPFNTVEQWPFAVSGTACELLSRPCFLTL